VPVPTVPSVPAPTPPAPVPNVPLPQPPPVPDPAPLPGTGGGGGGGGGGGSSSGGGGGGGGSTSSGGGGSNSSGGGGSSSSGGGSTSSSSSGGGAAGSSSSRSRARAAARAARRPTRRSERKLRRRVTRFTACLDDLSSSQERVLVLRAGVGSADPHSRQSVARILDVPVRRVVRIERRGLRTARSLSQAGACGGGGGTTSSSSVEPQYMVPGDTDTAAPDTAAGDGDPSLGRTETTKDDTAGGSGDVRGESETNLPPRTFPEDGSDAGGVSLAIGLALIVLALLAGFATPHVRARLRSP
jgi:hypothetical protein